MRAAHRRLAALILALAQTLSFAASREEAWDFTVYLDEGRVGSHRFSLTENGAGRTLRSDARFDVKIFLINAYRYVHQAEEHWRGDCLEALSAHTDDNGDASEVSGQLRDGVFRLDARGAEQPLAPCVMTFAYWNPAMRQQSRLLNPQTGEYLPVRVEARGREPVPVRGRTVTAERYRLDAGKFRIDLWYADGGRWVALDSSLENGRTLHYRIE